MGQSVTKQSEEWDLGAALASMNGNGNQQVAKSRKKKKKKVKQVPAIVDQIVVPLVGFESKLDGMSGGAAADTSTAKTKRKKKNKKGQEVSAVTIPEVLSIAVSPTATTLDESPHLSSIQSSSSDEYFNAESSLPDLTLAEAAAVLSDITISMQPDASRAEDKQVSAEEISELWLATERMQPDASRAEDKQVSAEEISELWLATEQGMTNIKQLININNADAEYRLSNVVLALEEIKDELKSEHRVDSCRYDAVFACINALSSSYGDYFTAMICVHDVYTPSIKRVHGLLASNDTALMQKSTKKIKPSVLDLMDKDQLEVGLHGTGHKITQPNSHLDIMPRSLPDYGDISDELLEIGKRVGQLTNLCRQECENRLIARSNMHNIIRPLIYDIMRIKADIWSNRRPNNYVRLKKLLITKFSGLIQELENLRELNKNPQLFIETGDNNKVYEEEQLGEVSGLTADIVQSKKSSNCKSIKKKKQHKNQVLKKVSSDASGESNVVGVAQDRIGDELAGMMQQVVPELSTKEIENALMQQESSDLLVDNANPDSKSGGHEPIVRLIELHNETCATIAATKEAINIPSASTAESLQPKETTNCKSMKKERQGKNVVAAINLSNAGEKSGATDATSDEGDIGLSVQKNALIQQANQVLQPTEEELDPTRTEDIDPFILDKAALMAINCGDEMVLVQAVEREGAAREAMIERVAKDDLTTCALSVDSTSTETLKISDLEEYHATHGAMIYSKSMQLLPKEEIALSLNTEIIARSMGVIGGNELEGLFFQVEEMKCMHNAQVSTDYIKRSAAVVLITPPQHEESPEPIMNCMDVHREYTELHKTCSDRLASKISETSSTTESLIKKYEEIYENHKRIPELGQNGYFANHINQMRNKISIMIEKFRLEESSKITGQDAQAEVFVENKGMGRPMVNIANYLHFEESLNRRRNNIYKTFRGLRRADNLLDLSRQIHYLRLICIARLKDQDLKIALTAELISQKYEEVCGSQINHGINIKKNKERILKLLARIRKEEVVRDKTCETLSLLDVVASQYSPDNARKCFIEEALLAEHEATRCLVQLIHICRGAVNGNYTYSSVTLRYILDAIMSFVALGSIPCSNYYEVTLLAREVAKGIMAINKVRAHELLDDITAKCAEFFENKPASGGLLIDINQMFETDLVVCLELLNKKCLDVMIKRAECSTSVLKFMLSILMDANELDKTPCSDPDKAKLLAQGIEENISIIDEKNTLHDLRYEAQSHLLCIAANLHDNCLEAIYERIDDWSIDVRTSEELSRNLSTLLETRERTQLSYKESIAFKNKVHEIQRSISLLQLRESNNASVNLLSACNANLYYMSRNAREGVAPAYLSIRTLESLSKEFDEINHSLHRMTISRDNQDLIKALHCQIEDSLAHMRVFCEPIAKTEMESDPLPDSCLSWPSAETVIMEGERTFIDNEGRIAMTQEYLPRKEVCKFLWNTKGIKSLDLTLSSTKDQLDEAPNNTLSGSEVSYMDAVSESFHVQKGGGR